MKYLKSFEALDKLKFEIGDYVRIKKGRCYPKYYKKVFKLISLENEDIGGLWGLKSILADPEANDKVFDYLYFYTWDLVKATKKEADAEIAANKFNI